MSDLLHGVATVLSLWLTWPALFICVMVLMAWHTEYISYCMSKNRAPSQLLIAGVFIGFCGSFVDNTYWGIAWSLDFIGAPEGSQVDAWRDWFFHNGVYPNVAFRQSALLYAGVLHTLSEIMSRRTDKEKLRGRKRLINGVVASAIFGAIYVSGLIALSV